MSYRHEIADNASAAFAATTSVLADARAAGEVPVLLVPTFAAGNAHRRAFAKGPLAFGVDIATPAAWISDRWEVFGDGRTIVGAGERTLLLYRLLVEEQETARDMAYEALEATPGTVEVLASMARDALPQLVGEKAEMSREAGVLSGAEKSALALLRRYAELLEKRGQCEASQAAALLPERLGIVPTIVALGIDEAGHATDVLLSALGERTEVVRIDDGARVPSLEIARAPELQALLGHLFKAADTPLVPTGAVRFLLPAGATAAPPLIARAAIAAAQAAKTAGTDADAADAAGVAGTAGADADAAGVAETAGADAVFPSPLSFAAVVIAAKDPAALFTEVAPRLAISGVAVGVSARLPFGKTAFGRSFLALARLATTALDGAQAALTAADFALGAFSGVAPERASALDAAWRGDRTVDREQVVADLAAASAPAAKALACFAVGDWAAAVASLEASAYRRRGLPSADLRVVQAAAAGARRFADEAASAGVAPERALEFLRFRSIPFETMTPPVRADECRGNASSSTPFVHIVSLDEAASCAPCSCSTLIVCDLEATAYPVRQAEDARTLLFEKLGLPAPADALAASRRRFFRALSAPCDAVICERVLATPEADAAYSAIMLEELLDCYRADPTADDLDNATGLPALLLPFFETAGEDDLSGNLASAGTPLRAAEVLDVPPAGRVTPAHRGFIVLPREGAATAEADTLQLSPSAIESYLECPYKWFSLRRLRLGEPDAGFGPLEMGSFSHEVLKSFYRHFHEAGHLKVSSANRDVARALLRETFARHRAFQHELSRNRNPLIPRTALEEAEMDDLGRKLVAFLDRESALLPGFTPTHFEFAFGDENPVRYAGCLLRGSVDRIDVNGRGQAVVIDYKGSLTDDYPLASRSPLAADALGEAYALPHKVQALIYAQVVRRLLGLDVVGALYVSYGRDGRVAGAYDRTVLGPTDIPGIDEERCGVPGAASEELFTDVLDAVENAITRALACLASGDIGPAPRGGDPCGFCPVLACEIRRGA